MARFRLELGPVPLHHQVYVDLVSALDSSEWRPGDRLPAERELAQRYGIIYCNSNSSADTVTNEKCQRVNFVWDANNWMFANALGPLVAKNLGTKWFILTHDHVWGKNATGGTRENMKKVGAEELGELMVPQGARDFSAQVKEKMLLAGFVVILTLMVTVIYNDIAKRWPLGS